MTWCVKGQCRTLIDSIWIFFIFLFFIYLSLPFILCDVMAITHRSGLKLLNKNPSETKFSCFWFRHLLYAISKCSWSNEIHWNICKLSVERYTDLISYAFNVATKWKKNPKKIFFFISLRSRKNLFSFLVKTCCNKRIVRQQRRRNKNGFMPVIEKPQKTCINHSSKRKKFNT